MGDRYPLTVFGRLLQCVKCHATVDLIELPSPWIDGDTYVCGLCLEPVTRTAEPPAPPRVRIPEPQAPPVRNAA